MRNADESIELWEEVTPTAYRRALSAVPTSVVVAASIRDGEPIGMVIGTFTSVSLDPPLVGFFGDRKSSTLGPLLTCEYLTFSLLRQEDLAVCAAFRRPLRERFSAVTWFPSRYGTPVLDNAVLTVHTRLYDVSDAGDHRCVLAQVIGLETAGTVRRPLLFHKHRFSRLDPGRVLAEELWQLGWDGPE